MRQHATGGRLRARLAAGVLAVGTLAVSTLVAGLAPAGASPALPAAGGPVALTRLGAVQGKTVSGISEFLGIPYAAPPTGALRWHAPEPPAPWRGIRAATAFGAHCPQPGSAAGTSESCLFLNVFTKPGASRPGRPVMVWVHGGALVTGASDSYNPASLVNDGVTVVTINSRPGCSSGPSSRAAPTTRRRPRWPAPRRAARRSRPGWAGSTGSRSSWAPTWASRRPWRRRSWRSTRWPASPARRSPSARSAPTRSSPATR